MARDRFPEDCKALSFSYLVDGAEEGPFQQKLTWMLVFTVLLTTKCPTCGATGRDSTTRMEVADSFLVNSFPLMVSA